MDWRGENGAKEANKKTVSVIEARRQRGLHCGRGCGDGDKKTDLDRFK